jgi:alpha-mannosidase
LRIDAREWPERVDDSGQRVGRRDVAVTTVLELRAGSSLVHVEVAFDNQCDDHRLRVHLPLPAPAERSEAECAFAVVSRGLVAEGGPSERALATFPSQRFVRAGGLTVVHEGLNEYELIDVVDGGAHTLAVTLLRASRYLSRGPMTARTEPPVGDRTARIAGARPVPCSFRDRRRRRRSYAAVDDAFLRSWSPAVPGSARFRAPSVLAVAGAEVASVRRAAVSCRCGSSTRARQVSSPSTAPVGLSICWPSIEAIDGSFTMRPGQIATLVLPDS